MKQRRRLFNTKDPYDLHQSDDAFFEAMKENCIFHYEHCQEYQKILDGMGFDPHRIKKYSDIADIPFIPTLIYKKHKLFSLPKHQMIVRATSSGTSGKTSEIGYTVSDLYCGLKMVLKVSKLRGLFSPVPCHYILFGYKPHRSNKTAVTKTALGATFFTPALSRTYALKYQNGKYCPDLKGVLKAIIRHSKSNFPVRFMGFPSYTYFLMKMMDEKGIRVKLPKNSKIMLGGGWKQFYAEQVDKSVFYALAKKVFGIEDKDIIEFFGAVEHPILYCDCRNHHFHVPVYGRVIIRDTKTLEPLENGKPGLVNLMTPMVKATPILSVMTDDIGILHDEENCGCGLHSPYLEILGRIGLKDIKTCAAGAAEILSEVEL
ncbi:MAG: acyl-protein synthetase [Clostridia bacterium]|nr:acyl-protein synthetase [Clostridia bacterium]